MISDLHDPTEIIELGMSDRPGETGRFGSFGGRFIPETLMGAVLELAEQFETAWQEPAFVEGWLDVLRHYSGRPTELYFAERLSEDLGIQVYLKREDLNHTGAHKINNTLGQALLCLRMGKQRVIAETGAGQHGVATATAAARYGLECKVFMGAKDVERQAPNVQRMKMLGAEVVPVHKGTSTLKDATNEALRYWVSNVHDTHYVIGSAVGPHPYPWMVRAFQAVIGYEARKQVLAMAGKLPTAMIACVGGGSNSIGAFHAFRHDEGTRLIGAEAGGFGVGVGPHGASITAGEPGVLHGSMSMLMMDDNGQIQEPHSISAGLDYPGVGPELAHLNEIDRAEFVPVTDDDALKAFTWISRLEGIVPALESAHALALLRNKAKEFGPDDVVIVNLSGRGDKDLGQLEGKLDV